MSREARAMNEAKPFASLSSTLLARKGQAKPAMRPQGFHMPIMTILAGTIWAMIRGLSRCIRTFLST